MAQYKETGVPTVIYYSKCMHEQSAYQSLGYKSGAFPNAETLSKTVFSLPMHGYLKNKTPIINC